MRTAVLTAALILAPVGAFAGNASEAPRFQLKAEVALDTFGGIPFVYDLDGDGACENLWLQSPGIFHSKVFDVPPWQGQFTPEERAHFCLTATDAEGRVLWRIGEPWAGKHPFVTHCGERALDAADIDGDGVLEVVCARRDELLVIDSATGAIENQTTLPADNGQIVRIARTGAGPRDWTILVKNSESAYAPHEYANPAWFYDPGLTLVKTADYHGAGHAPRVIDLDGDGLDEFLIGYNLVDSKFETRWTYEPVARGAWDAAEMHVDYMSPIQLDGRHCVAMAASNMTYLFDTSTGDLIWKREGTHPQYCATGRFRAEAPAPQVMVFNKRADIQFLDGSGNEVWALTPPRNFPLGQAEPCKRQAFHTFDPLTVLNHEGRDYGVFSDAGWPYGIDGNGTRAFEFPYTQNAAQDWGEVPGRDEPGVAPGRPDDYGYGFYVRVSNFDEDDSPEVLINDRRYAWLYEVASQTTAEIQRSDGRTLNIDFENYTDGVVQALNAGVRWLGDPFTDWNEGAVEITRGEAFAGSRSGHASTTAPDQIGRIRLEPRFDAPQPNGDAVLETVFRVTANDASNLDDFVVFSTADAQRRPVGISILANGAADSSVYQLDVVHASHDGGEARTDRVRTDLTQNEWIRLVLRRNRAAGTVDFWVGPPDDESWAGVFPDRNPTVEVHTIELGDTSRESYAGSGYWDDVRIGAPLESRGVVAAPEPKLRDLRGEIPAPETPYHVGRERQLFVDDAIVEHAENTTRTLHPAIKYPNNPVFVAEAPWEIGGTWFVPYEVLRETDSGPYRMWYGAYRKSENKLTYTCLAESADGIEWQRPMLGLYEVEGSKDNNIVWQGRALKPNYHPDDPDPARRYKAMTRSDAFTPLFSPDGIHWIEAPTPVISQAYDATSFHWDPIEKKWIAAVKIFRDGKRARGYAESKDYVHWTDTYFMLAADERDHPDDELYSLWIFRYESAYIGILKVYHVATDRCDLQLAFSRDGRYWTRPFRAPFIANSNSPGAYDYGNLDPASSPIRIGDELRMYYGGRSVLHNEPPTDTNGSLCVAHLRVDGFVSVDGGNAPGYVTTRPLLLEGRTLFVNADASRGELRVEALDGSGNVLRSYDAENCVPITEDAIRIPVRWNHGESIDALTQHPTRLRFILKDASLFSFWLE